MHGLAAAIGQPLWGRLLDRRGHYLAIGLTALTSAAAFTGLAFHQPVQHPDLAAAIAAVAGVCTPPLEAALRVLGPHVVRSPHQRRAALSLDACARELVFIGGPLLVLAPHTLTGTTVVPIATAAIVLAGCALFLTAPPAAPHVEAVLHPHALARPDPYPWSARPGGSPVRGGHHPGSTQRRRPRRRRTSPRRVPLDDDARGARRRQPDRRPPLRTPHLALHADASTPHARLRLCGRFPADACRPRPRPRPCPGHHGRRTARPLPRAAAGDGLPHAGLPRPPPTLAEASAWLIASLGLGQAGGIALAVLVPAATAHAAAAGVAAGGAAAGSVVLPPLHPCCRPPSGGGCSAEPPTRP
ncbi:MFS transporter [Streptomyces sp. H27-H1]|uniref:MFS transporter n=1 Tax=Streptomyces sp. H27-H1 TaxID=2996461 RepID=UPI003B63A721